MHESQHTLYEIYIIISILQIKKLGFREVRSFPQIGQCEDRVGALSLLTTAYLTPKIKDTVVH